MVKTVGVREGTSGRLLIKWRPSSAGLPSFSWWKMRVRSYLEILHQMLERRSPREDDFLLSKPLQMSAFLERSNPGEIHQASARLPFNYFKLSKGQIFYSYCCKYYWKVPYLIAWKFLALCVFSSWLKINFCLFKFLALGWKCFILSPW